MIASWRAQDAEPHECIWKKQQELQEEQQQLEEQEQTSKIWHGERIGEPCIGELRRRRASEPIIHR